MCPLLPLSIIAGPSNAKEIVEYAEGTISATAGVSEEVSSIPAMASRYADGLEAVCLLWAWNFRSSRIMYRHGTSTRMIAVAKTIPKPSEIAIGTR